MAIWQSSTIPRGKQRANWRSLDRIISKKNAAALQKELILRSGSVIITL
jgi:hypothetical protein